MFHSPARRGYTLPETVMVLGLILIAMTAIVAGGRVWLADQRTGQVNTMLDAAVTVQHVQHTRFGEFAHLSSGVDLEDLLGNAIVHTTDPSTSAHGVGEIFMADGTYIDPTAGLVDAVVMGITDVSVCRYRVVPDPDVRDAEVRDGQFPGRCSVTTLKTETGIA